MQRLRLLAALLCAAATITTATIVFLAVAPAAAGAGAVAPAISRPAVVLDEEPRVRYRPPVDAPVRDPYRAPAGPYAPGNRGIEFDTAPGAPVLAPAEGTVAFAGVVARQRWVSITHRDGLRSTVGPLSDVSVTAGRRVSAGDQVGRADGPLLFTLRRGENYIDPASVLEASGSWVHLAKLQAAASSGGLALPSLGQLAPLLEQVASGAAGAAGAAAAGWLWVPMWSAPTLVDPGRLIWEAGVAARDWWEQRSSCTARSVAPPPPPTRRVAVLVAGLGSTSKAASIDDLDVGALGYAPGDVIRFSYRGGRIPGQVSGELAAISVSGYEQVDTLGDLDVAAARLADLLIEAADALPAGVPLDVMAHSQGGLITRLALVLIERRRPDLLVRLGLVATLASPHHGAPIAGGVTLLTEMPVLDRGVDQVEQIAGTGLDPRSPAVRQLAPHSSVITALDGLRPPSGVRVISIAARGDLVVPVPRTRIDGARNITVAVDGLNDHAGLPGSPAALREIALGIAGLDPTCVGLGEGILGAVAGSVVDQLEGGAAG